MKKREVARVVTSHQRREGGGFVVRRPFPSGAFDDADPFLLLDGSHDRGRPRHRARHRLREPVARYGPFVMNTEREIQQAILDHRAGRHGAIERSVKRHDSPQGERR